ncbi:MAG TPA: hypothetical protein VEF05_04780 [Terriglobales bacterium]|nr:hypothetical protein [Terriglobales bacterium]
MSFDVAYSYLIDLTWFFLGGWVLLLATAYVLAFTGDGIGGTAKDDK